MTEGTLQAGFGRATLWGSWKTDVRLADDVDARVLALRRGKTVALLAISDFCEYWPENARQIRKHVAGELNIPIGHIGVFTTQNHSSSGDYDPLDQSRVRHAFLDAARIAMQGLRPVEMAKIAVHPQRPLNACRRVSVGPLEAMTCWHGFRVSDDRADCSHIIRQAFCDLAAGEPIPARSPVVPDEPTNEDLQAPESPWPVPEPLYLPPASDDLVQALFFRTLDGEPWGSVLRFAAHPVTANAIGADYASGDFPAYARRRLESCFGGRSVFLTGPCGDQCPLIDVKSVDFARALGYQLADVALAALDDGDWTRDPELEVLPGEVELRFRRDIPDSAAAAHAAEARAQEALAEAVARPLDPREIARCAQVCEFLDYVAGGSLHRWTGIEPAGCAGRVMRHPLLGIRLGDVRLVGLPGEPFGRYSVCLREQSIGDDLIVVEQCNGYLGYLPTAKEWRKGSYEAAACLFDETLEDCLLAAGLDLTCNRPSIASLIRR